MNKPNKLSLLHFIETDKATYRIYNIECLKDSNVNIWIERDGISILEKEIFEESWSTLGGESFTRFVMSCLEVLRTHISILNEVILKDEKMI